MKQGFTILALLSILGCAEEISNSSSEITSEGASNTVSQTIVRKVQSQSVINLCRNYQSSAVSNFEKLAIESELVLRGQDSCQGASIGAISRSSYNSSLYPRGSVGAAISTPNRDLYNCDTFRSEAEAQRFFLSNGGPSSDPYDLDRDGDGLACEWGARATRLRPSPKPSYVPVATTSSLKCYTGPRGGTYTLTSSGKKNYNGC